MDVIHFIYMFYFDFFFPSPFHFLKEVMQNYIFTVRPSFSFENVKALVI